MLAKSCVRGLYPMPRGRRAEVRVRAHELARGDHLRRALRTTRRAVFEPFRPPARSRPRERVQASQMVKVCRKEHVARTDAKSRGTLRDPSYGR